MKVHSQSIQVQVDMEQMKVRCYTRFSLCTSQPNQTLRLVSKQLSILSITSDNLVQAKYLSESEQANASKSQSLLKFPCAYYSMKTLLQAVTQESQSIYLTFKEAVP